METKDLVLPTHMEILHKFLTVSLHLTIVSGTQKPLFEIECPSLRIKKSAYIYFADSEREMLCWMCPVWGMKWNIMVSLPDDKILGVIRRDKNELTGRTRWNVLDAEGNDLMVVKQEGSAIERLRKRVTLFSERRELIHAGDQYVGAFVSRSGYVHENHKMLLDPETHVTFDKRMILSTIVVLTGVFDRIFT